jgi:hypothetical protein
MRKTDDLRAAVSRADEVLGCAFTQCRYKPYRDGLPGRCQCGVIDVSANALEAVYKAAKAAVEEADIRRMVDGAMILPHDGDTRMFAEAFDEVCAHVRNASDESEPQIIPSLGLDLATLEPYLNRDVEFMGLRGTVRDLKMASSCMTLVEHRCEVTSISNDEVRAKWEATLGLDNVLKTCWCFRCLDEPSMGPFNPAMRRMILCPQCGNKRCPRATSHDNACSGSNESGQDGSRYK